MDLAVANYVGGDVSVLRGNGDGTFGVDLNRNHSFKWGCCGGSSSDPCGITYRGPQAASEPETQAFQTHFASVLRDQNGPNGDDELPPAAPITTTGGHCYFLGGEVEGIEGLQRAVRQRHKAGVDFIKVMTTGGGLTPGSNRGRASSRPASARPV